MLSEDSFQILHLNSSAVAQEKKKITVISKHFGLTEEKNFNCTIATTNHRALSEKTMY